MKQIKLAGISGSLRRDSFNTRLLKNVNDLLPEHVSMDILSIDLPLYNADLDLPQAKERPANVQQFRDQLAAADGVVIVSPEYNFSIPGLLKNAIDWASRGKDSPLLKKPVALMGATQGLWGTAKMQIAFLPVFQFMDMKVVQQPEVLLAQAQDKFDENGKLKDETSVKLIKQKIEALMKLIEG
jgi:chromate reductase